MHIFGTRATRILGRVHGHALTAQVITTDRCHPIAIKPSVVCEFIVDEFVVDGSVTDYGHWNVPTIYRIRVCMWLRDSRPPAFDPITSPDSRWIYIIIQFHSSGRHFRWV